MIVVSACLAGIPCRYDGSARSDKDVMRLVEKEEAVCACPECMAGLRSPRPPAEIVGGSGEDVLDGGAKVMNKEGLDVTEEFIAGAHQFLGFVEKHKPDHVVLKSKSPSCGVSKIYDGSFSGRLIDGCGVTAALLKRNGIHLVEV